jgi:uncharacterized membrane protein YhaH (DUF805 family)
MTFTSAIATCFRKYADFSGRARRSEYWKFMFFTMIVEVLTTAVFTTIIPIVVDINGSEISLIYLAACLIFALPKLAVSVRRLHDIGKSGWFYLISLIPVVGQIIFFIWCVKDSEARTNKYGKDPKEAEDFCQAMQLQHV